jgi:integrase
MGFTLTQARDLVVALKTGGEVRALTSKPVSSEFKEVAALYLQYLRDHDGRNIKEKEVHLRKHLLPALAGRDVPSLTEDDWAKYVATRRRLGAAPGSINRERSTLLHLLNTAVRRQWVTAHAFKSQRQCEPPGKLIYLSPGQLEKLLAAARTDHNPLVHRFVMIGAYTGMRQEAILQLRVRDIDFGRRLIRVVKDKAGARDQPIPKVLADYLACELRGNGSAAFLFPSHRSRYGRVYQMNTQFARCVSRAGLGADVTPHTLRHTMATNASHAGVDAATIQGMGGWKTRAMVERYTHAKALQTGMDQLEAHFDRQRFTSHVAEAE